MARRPQEDLFEGTKMTFGEHIEELRASLFQAIIGLFLGVLLGFLFATTVVKWIQSPLERALRAYYRESATEALKAEYREKNQNVPVEVLGVIDEGWAPDMLKVSPEGLLEAIQRTNPEQVGNVSLAPYRFTTDDLEFASLAEFLRGWAEAGREEGRSAESELWEMLSPEQQRQIENLVAKENLNRADAAALTTVLNELAGRASLRDAPSFKTLEADDPDLQAAIVELRQKAASTEGLSDSETRRLNRLLLTAIFPDHLRKPRLTLVDLPIWRPIHVNVVALGAQEAFMIWLKAAFITGLVISAPWVFWKIWNFVAAGLYPHEKHYVYLYLPVSLFLFFGGASLAFFFVFEPVLRFLFSFNRAMDIDPDPRISEWLSFVLFLPLGFGISFQLPLVMLFLQRIGIFTVEMYMSKWRIAILAIFVISMVLTPADPISMMLMACPLSVLYFGGLAMCKWMPRGRNPYSELQTYEP
jgi:sec-independent protein translocase protein TatC